MSRSHHGTRARYVIDGCRCMPCTDANRDYMRELAAERKQPWRVRAISGGTAGAEPSYYRVEHTGTGEIEATGIDADVAYELRDQLNKNAWMDGEEPPGPRFAHPKTAWAARRRLRELREAGVGLRRVAEISGVNRKTLQALLHGDHRPDRRGDDRRFRRRIVDAVLAVPIGAAADGALVDATETWRLIDEMLAAGATRTRIAKELGSRAKTPALQLQRDRVTRGKADAVKRLHDAFYRGSARMREACQCERDVVGRRRAA